MAQPFPRAADLDPAPVACPSGEMTWFCAGDPLGRWVSRTDFGWQALPARGEHTAGGLATYRSTIPSRRPCRHYGGIHRRAAGIRRAERPERLHGEVFVELVANIENAKRTLQWWARDIGVFGPRLPGHTQLTTIACMRRGADEPARAESAPRSGIRRTIPASLQGGQSKPSTGAGSDRASAHAT